VDGDLLQSNGTCVNPWRYHFFFTLALGLSEAVTGRSDKKVEHEKKKGFLILFILNFNILLSDSAVIH
jgi:hypothetical protein